MIKNSNKISVLMSVYNSEKTISNSINSILNQSYTNFELLIVNDASTDSTIEICKNFENLDNRIQIYNNKKNIGLTKSLNYLIPFTTGDYIARQDADDLSLSSRFEKQIEIFSNTKADSCNTRAIIKESNIVTPSVSYYLPFIISILKPYQKSRILTFFNPERDPLGAGYQIIQSKIAIGSGGMHGKGFLQGTQSYLEFLPEKHTDFIFTLFSEEFGFIGSILLIFLYALLIYRIIKIGFSCRSFFAKLYCFGFSTALFLYVFVNIAMVVGLLPIVGAPLPIMSYGGSSMLSIMIGLSIVMSCKIYSREIISN